MGWLIGVVIYRFHNNIGALFDALVKRVHAGGGIKAGPFELPELKPQAPEEQSKRIEAEIKQASQREYQSNEFTNSKHSESNNLILSKSEAIQAEDLALRAIQAQYGVAVGRQLQTGDLRFDGFFALEGQAHIVEVKFSRGRFDSFILLRTIEILIHSIDRYGWRNYKIIFVIVYDDHKINLADKKTRLSAEIEIYGGRIELELFQQSMLMEQFGISNSNKLPS